MAVDPIPAAGGRSTQAAGARVHLLFEAHARMVFGLCRALLRNPHDAEDATQATFVSAHKALLGGGEVRAPGAWLATIARNECANRARERMREPLPLLEADLEHEQGPEAELDRKALVGELQRAIAALPEKQREAVVLRDLYGLRYAEIGTALGMSIASVESLLFRARRRLRVSLRPFGGALTVPFEVREGIAQVLPGFTAARAAGGGTASGAAGLALFAKLSGGPAAAKAVTGVAAAITAASIAVVGIEQAERQPGGAEQLSARMQPAGAGKLEAAKALPNARLSSGAPGPAIDARGAGDERRGREGDGIDADGRSGRADGHGGDGQDDENRDRGKNPSAAGVRSSGDDGEESERSGAGDAATGTDRSRGDDGAGADEAPDVLTLERSGSSTPHTRESGEGEDDESSSGPGGSGGSSGSEEPDRPQGDSGAEGREAGETEAPESGHGRDDGDSELFPA